MDPIRLQIDLSNLFQEHREAIAGQATATAFKADNVQTDEMTKECYSPARFKNL
jgi:hypothetical protein